MRLRLVRGDIPPTQPRGHSQRAAQAGWTLIGLIILLTATLIASLSLVSAVAQTWRLSTLRANETRALYLAQAGVTDSIAAFRPGTTASDWFELNCFGNDPACDNAPDLNLAPGEVFIREDTDPDRDFLLVDMSSQNNGNPAVTGRTGGRSTFDDWELRRVVLDAGRNLTIWAMEVRWTGTPAARVSHVCFNVNAVVGGNPNPACLDVPDTLSGGRIDFAPAQRAVLTNNAWLSNNHLWFTQDIRQPGMTIALTFYVSDPAACAPLEAAIPALTDLAALRAYQSGEACRRTAVWVRGNSAQNWGLWTTRVTGEARSGLLTGRRRLRAEFRPYSTSSAQRNQIISWREE